MEDDHRRSLPDRPGMERRRTNWDTSLARIHGAAALQRTSRVWWQRYTERGEDEVSRIHPRVLAKIASAA